MVLIETKSGSRNAKLFCVGRDIENAEISLHFDSDLKKWIVTDELSTGQSKDNIFLAALYVYLKKHISFTGTASELVSELKEVTQEQFYPNRVTSAVHCQPICVRYPNITVLIVTVWYTLSTV